MYHSYDKIEIKGLEIFANHGVLPEENALGQKFIISVTLFVDTKKAGSSDELKDSVNYADVAKLIRSEASKKVFKLLEALAEYLTKRILLTFSGVKEVMLRIEKPWAPIGMSLDTVSVSIRRGWHDLYLSIGSNLGDKQENLTGAVHLLSEDEETRVLKVSDFIITKPVGDVVQDDFLNGVVYVQSLRTPESFLELIGEIEKKLKRERKIHWGPRTIDVDILLYDEEIICSESLMIPHPEMEKRQFVLEPLNEIAPFVRHPVSKKTVSELFRSYLRCSKATSREDGMD